LRQKAPRFQHFRDKLCRWRQVLYPCVGRFIFDFGKDDPSF